MWFLLSLFTAVLVAVSDALVKRLLNHHSPSAASFFRVAWGFLFLAPCLLIASPPSDPAFFWKHVLLAMPIEVVSALFFHQALRLAPLSVAIPFMAFTPVFLLGMGWLFLEERISLMGTAGVGCVVAGAFLVPRSTHDANRKNTEQKRGALLVLMAAFGYAITSTLCRRALTVASPLYFSPVYYGLLMVCLAPVAAGGRKEGAFFKTPGLWAAVGLCEAGVLLLQFHAFLMVETAYVIAIKRLSLLFAVFIGWRFFGERGLRRRGAAAALMVLGAALIAFQHQRRGG